MKIHVLKYDDKSQKMIAQSCIRFTDLKSRAVFTYRKDNNSPYATENDDNYQRQINGSRVKEIKDFLRNKILDGGNGFPVIFPTAMLLACSIDDLLPNYENGADIDVEMPEDFFIVDGQHRLFSMIELYEECRNLMPNEEDREIKAYLDKYEFNCTILFNLDMWEQGQVFVDVNFKQKSVNKSLYYEIYGTKFPENSNDYKRNCIFIAHSLTKFVNSNEKSPLRGFVKMLGNGRGLFSQASFVEALMVHMSSPLGVWYIDPDAEVKKSYRYMTIELFCFFHVVADMFRDLWPLKQEMKHRSILCKTTGIESMVKLMGFLHRHKIDTKIFDDIKKEKDIIIYKPYVEEVEKCLKKLQPHQYELFGLQEDGGQFCGTGGKGLVSKLYKRMIEIINE